MMKLKYSNSFKEFIFPIQYMAIPVEIIEVEKGIVLQIDEKQYSGLEEVLEKIKDLCKLDLHDLTLINDEAIKAILQLKNQRINKILGFLDETCAFDSHIPNNIELDSYYNGKHLTIVDLYIFSRLYRAVREENFVLNAKTQSWFFRFQDEICKNIFIEKIEEADFFNLKILVGRIETINDHPNADTLYIEEVSSDKNRIIVSGLRKFHEKKNLVGNSYLFLVNLKAQKLRGVASEGMILCGRSANGLVVPIEVKGDVGDQVKLEKTGHPVIPNLETSVYKASSDKIQKAMAELRIKDHCLMFKKRYLFLNNEKIHVEIKEGIVS